MKKLVLIAVSLLFAVPTTIALLTDSFSGISNGHVHIVRDSRGSLVVADSRAMSGILNECSYSAFEQGRSSVLTGDPVFSRTTIVAIVRCSDQAVPIHSLPLFLSEKYPDAHFDLIDMHDIVAQDGYLFYIYRDSGRYQVNYEQCLLMAIATLLVLCVPVLLLYRTLNTYSLNKDT